MVSKCMSFKCFPPKGNGLEPESGLGSKNSTGVGFVIQNRSVLKLDRGRDLGLELTHGWVLKSKVTIQNREWGLVWD